MNLAGMAAALAARQGIEEATALEILDAVFAGEGGIISDALRRSQRVEIRGFGVFETKTRKARTGRDPHSGRLVRSPAVPTVRFKPGKGLKEAVRSDSDPGGD